MYRIIGGNGPGPSGQAVKAGISGGAVAATLVAADVNPSAAVRALVARLFGTAADAGAGDGLGAGSAAGVLGPDVGTFAGALRAVLNTVRRSGGQ